MELEIDFSGVSDLNSMHKLLMEKFGFPDFYGKNVNALIDCLTSLRHPEDRMTNIHLASGEVLSLVVKSLPMDNLLILNNFLIAIQSVNERYINRGEAAVILLVLV